MKEILYYAPRDESMCGITIRIQYCARDEGECDSGRNGLALYRVLVTLALD